MASRLIEDFKKQTKDTILDYMDRLSVNNTVYSTYLKGYEPYLKERNLIIYLHDTSMVVVCFDLCGHIEEIADEEDDYDIGAPEYYSQRGGRKSPVWQLSEAMKDMVKRTTNYFPPIEIWGVLLSESKILNVSDMKYQWDEMNIHVIDNLMGLRHREIATNNAYNEKTRAILHDILDENTYIRTFKFEAYTLNGKHENDPGKIVIQLLLNILADESKRDIVIVLCGYKEPMEALLNANPGLQSRFPNKFVFDDFTIDELLEITLRRVRDYEYEFTPQAWIQYKKIVSKAYNQRESETWGNARFVANQLERIYIQHATRCVRMNPVDKRQFRLLTPEDVLPADELREKSRFGF